LFSSLALRLGNRPFYVGTRGCEVRRNDTDPRVEI
jgi:hypothetical protein